MNTLSTRTPRERLPELLDQKRLGEELGVKHATVEAIFKRLPKVAIPGHRKLFVRRADVECLLEECTYRDQDVRPTS
ncbi:MAG: hypothetical protein QOK40_405 [Miltoncostaeaceae bacterium]|jgi:hypothetical protein|nr:hypothetical protein [Miltoncostaeaceae bacterium]